MERWIGRIALGATAMTLACSGGLAPGRDGSGQVDGSGGGSSFRCVAKTCADLGTNCGSVEDGCGGWLQCGVCPSHQVCGGAGTPNVCGTEPCAPKSCADLGANCGQVSDGCGTLLACGTCAGEEVCGGGGVPNECGEISAGGQAGPPDAGAGGDDGTDFDGASTRWALELGAGHLATDASGNIYLTRDHATGRGFALTLEKLDASGTPIWTRDEDLPARATQLALSPSGDIFVAVDFCTDLPYEECDKVVKLDRSGNRLGTWLGPNYLDDVRILGLAIDREGSILVLEAGTDSESLVKYSSSGLLLWQAIFDVPVTSMATDGSDDVVVVGISNGRTVIEGDPRTQVGSSGSWTPFILKLDAEGHLLWSDAVAGAQGYLTHVGTSALGTVVAEGELQGSFRWGDDQLDAASPQSMLIVADSGGTQRFARSVPVPASASVLALDPSGTVAIAGTDESRTVVAELNLAGDLLWTRQFDGDDPAQASRLDVVTGAFLANHDLVLVGSYSGSEAFDGHSLPATTNREGFLLDLEQH